MLIVRPVRDKRFQEELCALMGVQFDATAFAYLAANTDDVGETYASFIGLIQFDIDADGARITSIGTMPDVDDMEAMIIMGRSLMCFLYRDMSIKTLRADGAVGEKYLSAFGLRNNGGVYSIDLEDFYTSPCKYNNLA